MRPYDIILKTREGQKLTEDEINYLIKGYTDGSIPDYQMSAWAMAVYFQGIEETETALLTKAMAHSGDVLDLSKIEGKIIDKHSTGGVGDTTSLVLIPLVAAAGVPVAKMSGRGLGHTGGTIDKLESIPGFNTNLSFSKFINNVNEIGMAICGQTSNLTPADKKLYSLRDVTATVDSISLIASSIMSKKIAGGADGIVLDVKVGKGAFMKNLNGARKLAETMVKIGKQVDIKTRAVITSMDQPLGYAIGNSLEIIEAIKTLSGEGPSDLRDICLALGAHMLVLAEKSSDFNQGYKMLENILNSGQALEKFISFIENQNGDVNIVDNFNILPQADKQTKVISDQSGYVSALNAYTVGHAAMIAGAGRKQKDDVIDPSAGVMLTKKCGDKVVKGDVLAVLYSNDNVKISAAEKLLKNAYKITEKKQEFSPLIRETIL